MSSNKTHVVDHGNGVLVIHRWILEDVADALSDYLNRHPEVEVATMISRENDGTTMEYIVIVRPKRLCAPAETP